MQFEAFHRTPDRGDRPRSHLGNLRMEKLSLAQHRSISSDILEACLLGRQLN